MLHYYCTNSPPKVPKRCCCCPYQPIIGGILLVWGPNTNQHSQDFFLSCLPSSCYSLSLENLQCLREQETLKAYCKWNYEWSSSTGRTRGISQQPVLNQINKLLNYPNCNNIFNMDFVGPWVDINRDFNLGLSQTRWGENSIFVIASGFPNMNRFTLCHQTFYGSKIVELFCKEFVCLHGMSKTNTINCDINTITKFKSHFWRLYCKR